MTDMFFASILIFALYNFYKYWQFKILKYYLLYLLFTVIAVLNRQHGLLLSLISLSLITNSTKNIKSYFLILMPLIISWLAHDKYRHYLTKNGIGHGIQYLGNLWDYLKTAQLNEHYLRAGDALLVIGGIILPIVIIILTSSKNSLSKHINYWFTLFILSSVILFLISFDINYFPQGNISKLLEIGPKAIKKVTPTINSNMMEYYKWSLIILSTGALICGFSFIIKKQSALFVKSKMMYTIILLISIVFFVFVSISKAYFDRYTIPIILFLIICLIPETLKINKTSNLMLSNILN